jgi:hypothetical protein
MLVHTAVLKGRIDPKQASVLIDMAMNTVHQNCHKPVNYHETSASRRSFYCLSKTPVKDWLHIHGPHASSDVILYYPEKTFFLLL